MLDVILAMTQSHGCHFHWPPEDIMEAAFQAISIIAVIDMSQHHENIQNWRYRCLPFVPVEGVNLKDCAEIAHKLGKELAANLISQFTFMKPQQNLLNALIWRIYEKENTKA